MYPEDVDRYSRHSQRSIELQVAPGPQRTAFRVKPD